MWLNQYPIVLSKINLRTTSYQPKWTIMYKVFDAKKWFPKRGGGMNTNQPKICSVEIISFKQVRDKGMWMHNQILSNVHNKSQVHAFQILNSYTSQYFGGFTAIRDLIFMRYPMPTTKVFYYIRGHCPTAWRSLPYFLEVTTLGGCCLWYYQGSTSTTKATQLLLLEEESLLLGVSEQKSFDVGYFQGNKR